MKNYTTCFLGIPLPQEYLKEFTKLLNDIHSIDPCIEITHPKTPHITIYYLDKQSQYSLEEIYKKIQPFTKSINGIKLLVGGLSYFTDDNPKVLFLDIKYPKLLTDYKNKVAEVLKEYSSSDNNLPFRPHMTVGRIKSQNSLKVTEKELAVKMDAINWSFRLNEIVLYGVDSTKSPEYQEKLLTILVK